MPYWDHEKAIGSAGGLFAVPIYPPPCTPRWGTEGHSLGQVKIGNNVQSRLSRSVF